jgi:NADH-quinone oxidoreductase subunit I
MKDLPGKGLAHGLKVTLDNLTRRSVTQHYPDVKPDLPPRSRGVIALFEENCTVCMLCARECPCWCIYIDSHKEAVPTSDSPSDSASDSRRSDSAAAAPTEQVDARERSHNVLDRFAIDYSLCMYCGICIDVCPFDALFWSPEFEYATTEIGDLTHEKDVLREWMWTVPAPPGVDPGAEPPKEIAAAERAAGEAAAPTQPGQRSGPGKDDEA